MIRNWKDSEGRETSETRTFSSSHQQRQVSKGVTTTTSSTSNGGSPHMTLYNTVIEEKIVIEQIDNSAAKLAEQLRITIEEKFRNLTTTVQDLLNWLKSIEKELGKQEPLREYLDELKQQISSLKFIHDDLWSHGDDVNSNFVQIRTTLTESTTLTTQNLQTLEEYGNQLKTRYDRAENAADLLLRKATTAYEELSKYTTEKNVFRDWLKTSCQKLVEIEQKIDLGTLKHPEKVRVFVNEVVSHKAELRFLEMNANRFTETTHDYLNTLNDIRAKFRLPALRKKGSEVQDEFKEITNVYNDLLSRTNKLLDSMDFKSRQKEFQTKVDEAINWLKLMTPKVQRLLDEPLKTKPKEADDQIRRAKTLHDEVYTNRTLITGVKHTGDALCRELPAAESAAVLRTCKEIEDRYDSLVTNVTSKLHDLESGASLVGKIDENLKSIRNLLDREESRLPSSSLGATPREAESIAQTLQQILRTLDDNTNLLDTTRSWVNELLRKGQGNEGLKTEFVSLQERWTTLEKTARDRLGFSDTIRKFYEQLTSVNKFLDVKQKVLENLSGEPQQQIQQLKALKSEVKGNATMLADINALGETLLRRANLTSHERLAIEESLATLNRRWTDFLALIDSKRAQVEALLDTKTDWLKTCSRIEEALRRVNDDLDTLAHDKNHLRQDALLKQIRAIEKSLNAQAGPIASLESAGHRLIEELPDQASKSDIKSKLATISRLYDQCTKKLEAFRRTVEAAEREAQDFTDACAVMQKWIDSTVPTFETVSISADRHILKGQVTHYEKACNEVLSKKNEITKLSQRGKDFDSPSFQHLLQSWASLEREAVSTRTRVNRAFDLCQKYDRVQQPFATWLFSASEKLNGISLDTLKKTEVERIQREMVDLKKECSRRTHEYTDVESGGQTFLSACDRDKDTVRAELHAMKEAWTAMQDQLEKRLARLNDLAEKLRAFHEQVAAIRKLMDRCDTELDTASGGQKLKALSEELAQIEKRLDVIKRQGDAICRIGDDEGADTDAVTKAVDDLYSRLALLRSKLSSRSDNLEAEQKALGLCHEKLRDITSNLSLLETELDSMKGIGREIHIVQSQISAMTEFKRRLREEQDQFEHLARHVDQLQQRGTDTTRLKPQLEDIRRKVGQINSKATTRSSDLDSMLKKLHDFYQLYKLTDEELNVVIRKEINIESVHGLEELKRREMAVVGKKVEEVNTVGKTLIKTASAGVNTTQLEGDLERMNEKWKQLNDKLAERKHLLENQHLKGKQFDDTVAAFLTALKNLDSLIVEEGRVHGDLDTVRPLVVQHKKVEDQLSNRRVQLQSIVKTAADMLESTSKLEERNKISHHVARSKEEFDKVKTRCDRRSHKLELALKDAEKLNSSVHSLLEWLAVQEKRKRTFPEVSTGLDEATAVKMLDEQEKFLREMERKQVEKDATLEFAREILAKAHPNAVNTIKNWISTIESKWTDLWSWTHKQRARLQDLLASLRESSDLLKELLTWLRKREDTLKRVDSRALPNDLDELLMLIREHNEFMESTDGRQNDVNFACGLKGGTTKRIVKASSPRAKSPSPVRDRSSLFPAVGPSFERSGEANPSGNAMIKIVWTKWKEVWHLSWDRQTRLERRYNELLRKFSWDDWKKRFLKHMNYNKDRVRELFTKFDRRNTGLVPRHKFIEAINGTNFAQTDSEMNEVANMFENGDDETDYIKFLAALRAEWADKKPLPESAQINNEIQRQVSRCTCKQRFRVEQVAEGTYRFGESQKLRLVRILRSTVMVRVGGGWVTLEEFLQKNDPCRMKGRTNVELREQLNTPEGAAHIMAAFTAKRRGDRDASKSHSPTPVRQPEKGIWKDRSTY